MPRVKLIEQKEYEFHYPVAVQPRDINYGGHLSYDALISLTGTARTYMFRSIGLSEADLGDGKTSILMSDLSVNYLAEGFMFDELQIDTHVGEFTRNSFRLFHRVTRGTTIIALVETGLVAFSKSSGRPVHVPETLLNALRLKRHS